MMGRTAGTDSETGRDLKSGPVWMLDNLKHSRPRIPTPPGPSRLCLAFTQTTAETNSNCQIVVRMNLPSRNYSVQPAYLTSLAPGSLLQVSEHS